MSTEHRYKLASNKVPKLNCPYCGAKKHWQRYIDIETGEVLPEHWGRCDNEVKCNEWNEPYKDGYAKAVWEQEQGNKTDWKPQTPKRIKKPVNKPNRAFIPVEVFNCTRAGYEQNTFIQNLLTRVAFPFEVQEIEKVISLYHLGTIQNGYRAGANTFPFIDVQGNIRAVQVKQFDEQNHTTGTDFLHSIIEKHHTRNNKPLPEWLEAYNKNEIKVSCLLGEHNLSKYPCNPIALVESPKAAIYGTLYFGFPEQPTNLLWLAVYNLSSLNLNKCKALKGRNVYLFPDLSKDGKAFELWSNKAAEIQKHLQGTYFQVSDLLERLAPQQDKEQGKDIADYLIKQDWRLFRKHNIKETPPPEPEPVKTSKGEKGEKGESLKKTFFSHPEPLPTVEVFPTEPIIKEQPENWRNDIAKLEKFFAAIALPTHPVKLNNWTTITDCAHYVNSYFNTVKANNGNKAYLPYLKQLQEFEKFLSTSMQLV